MKSRNTDVFDAEVGPQKDSPMLSPLFACIYNPFNCGWERGRKAIYLGSVSLPMALPPARSPRALAVIDVSPCERAGQELS
jgi:hypothetical protein